MSLSFYTKNSQQNSIFAHLNKTYTMKTSFLKFFALVGIISLTSCGNKAKEADTKAAKEASIAEASATTFSADASKSTIMWKGFKPTGSHTGTIAIANGTLKVNKDIVESGSFTIDMNSITVTDIPAEEEANGKLKGHLTSPDFFDVSAYPTAKFEVTSLKKENGKAILSGNLTLKNATNNISFPVNTTEDGSKMTLTSETFTIDRSKWDVRYGSKSFFDNLGNKFINDDIELTINLVATKS